MNYSLTILTPLYNRKNYLQRIFDSLKSQDDKDFQWLVIDDGSTENSFNEFEDFAQNADFKIDYHYKENGGKHTALNYSHPYIESDWVLILDSDDVLTADAVSTAKKYINRYNDNSDIGIISLQKGFSVDRPTVSFSEEETVSDYIEYRINANRKGDCCEIVRASVLKEYKFPVFDNEKFMNESHLWVGSADKYKTVYIPKVIYICEYLEEGLSKSGRSFWRKSPNGCIHSQIVGLNRRCSLKYRIKKALLIHYYGRILGLSTREICQRSGHPAFVRLFTVPGKLLYLYWERKYS